VQCSCKESRRRGHEANAPAIFRVCQSCQRWAKKHADDVPTLRTALETLAEDAFHPALRTHKLKGELAGSWACSAGYDVRIIFDFVQHEDSEAILLLTLGTHDEVY
jgi:mRNA-degrading endonuclease YafQ of YafQ-DinJ toxin-antitoxin module